MIPGTWVLQAVATHAKLRRQSKHTHHARGQALHTVHSGLNGSECECAFSRYATNYGPSLRARVRSWDHGEHQTYCDSDAWVDSKANYARVLGVLQSSGFWKVEVWGDAVTIDSGDDVHAFLMCLSSIPEGPKIIAELPENVVTDKMLYATFADFLTKPAEDQDYVIEPGNKNSGQSLSYGVVGNAIRAVLWIARAAHYEKGTSDIKIFFQCLDTSRHQLLV